MRGFSLIELLVTLAIVGVLAAIALPGYSQMINRALRQDARLALLHIQHRQEIFFASNLRYSQRLEGSDSAALGVSARSDAGHYLLELHTATDGMTYTVRARANPAGRQSSDAHCTQFEISESGHRRSAAADSNWREDDPWRCWS